MTFLNLNTPRIIILFSFMLKNYLFSHIPHTQENTISILKFTRDVLLTILLIQHDQQSQQVLTVCVCILILLEAMKKVKKYHKESLSVSLYKYLLTAVWPLLSITLLIGSIPISSCNHSQISL